MLAFGLYPTVDDVAKLVTLFQNGGRHDGRQLLSAAGVAEALTRAGAAGLPTGRSNRFGDERDHLGFRSLAYRTGGCTLQIPYMAGFGGNFVVVLPNGISAFRLGDSFTCDLEPMILAAESIRPPCDSAAAVTAPALPLTEPELRAELSGRTLLVGTQEIAFAGGRLQGRAGEDVDVGTWELTADGRYCRRWHVWDDGRRRCHTVHRAGETLEFFAEGRWGRSVARRSAQ